MIAVDNLLTEVLPYKCSLYILKKKTDQAFSGLFFSVVHNNVTWNNILFFQTEQILTEFRIKAKNLHPDKNPDPKAAEEFAKLVEAKEVLTDPDVCSILKGFISLQ